MVVASGWGGKPGKMRYDAAGVPLGPISASYMAKLPLAHLWYPGSTVYMPIAVGSDDKPGSDEIANAGAMLLVRGATGGQILQWYYNQLTSHGWHFGADGGCGAWQGTCPQYDAPNGTKDWYREGFEVSLLCPKAVNEMVDPKPVPAGTMLYQEIIIYHNPVDSSHPFYGITNSPVPDWSTDDNVFSFAYRTPTSCNTATWSAPSASPTTVP